MKMKIVVEASTGIKKLFDGVPFEDIDLVMSFVDFKEEFNKVATKFTEGSKAIEYKYNTILTNKGTLTVAERKEMEKERKELGEREVKLTVPFVPFDVLQKRIKDSASKKKLDDNDLNIGDLTSFIAIGLTKKK